MKLLRLCLAWVAGVCLGSLPFLPLPALAGGAGLAVVVVRVRCGKGWARVGLVLVVLVAGAAWCRVKVQPSTLPEFVGEVVVMEGTVVQGTECRGSRAWLGLAVERVEVGERLREVSGRVLVYTDPYPSYSQGDVLRIAGRIRPLSEVSNAGYREHLAGQGFVGTVDGGTRMELIRRSWLFAFRDRLAASLGEALPEPQASLAEGLLLGLRSHLPEELKEDFRRTGTSHLLAISGFNLAVIGGVVLAAAARLLGRRQPAYLAVTLVIVWLYSALTGMQPPVLRAAIMFSLLLAGLLAGRPGGAPAALGLAAAVMTGLDPGILYDVSFQLSFASVAGLMVLQPPLQRWGERVMPEGRPLLSLVRPLFNALAAGLAAIVASLPLVACHFQSMPLVGLPATVAASVFVTAATLSAGAVALLGLVWPGGAWVAGWVASCFLMCIVWVVKLSARLPLACVETGAVPSGVVWAYYLALLGVAGRRRLAAAASGALRMARGVVDGAARAAWRLPRKPTAGVLVVSAVLAWAGFASLPGGHLQVSFLDVGQGDAILVITPAGQQVLIDGGPGPDTACQLLGEKLPFWDKSLDVVVLTHSHDDHLVGLLPVLERYRVGLVVESGLGEGPLYREWRTRVEDRGIPWMAARAGQWIDLGEGICLEVVHPGDRLIEGTASEANSNSLVLRLCWRQVSFLLAADADWEAERVMLYGGVVRDMQSDVLKVGHHGSNLSTSPAFLAAVDPRVAVISVGAGNLFGHPGEATLAALDGVEVYRTDEDGTITFTTDGERLWVSTAGAAVVRGGPTPR